MNKGKLVLSFAAIPLLAAFPVFADGGSAVNPNPDTVLDRRMMDRDNSGLWDLIILDRLFDGNGGGGIFDGDGNDLRDLFVLDRLFDGNGGFFGGDSNISDLFLLDRLSDGGGLTDLIILDRLFDR